MKPPTAKTADKYTLYGQAVQTPNDDARFLTRYFRKVTGRPLRILREDFCGTANILSEFVKLHRANRGIGVDLDPEPLAWCRQHTLPALTESQRERISLVRADVNQIHSPKADLIFAFNFSHCIFKTRRELRTYFKNARRALTAGGIFIADVQVGTQIPVVSSDTWNVGNFKYTWQVVRFDPITHHILCKIHFLFQDGSRMRNAFVYDWRMWTLPEVKELFHEAGFKNIHVLWEQKDRATGQGNGVMQRVQYGQLQAAAYAMVVGQA